ncbi:hypothetical protein FKW77_003292 [Venturia effusa]|uniref:Uncharacterized protein n=1 Tax=Venturia effusa TaxID=50376 RepID=A0A517LAN6_9PEZI|nr:hypothetical protein FKW77_003292 [Venturia effusa]
MDCVLILGAIGAAGKLVYDVSGRTKHQSELPMDESLLRQKSTATTGLVRGSFTNHQPPAPAPVQSFLPAPRDSLAHLSNLDQPGLSTRTIFSILVISALGILIWLYASDCWKCIADHFEDTLYDDESDETDNQKEVTSNSSALDAQLRAKASDTSSATKPSSHPHILTKSASTRKRCTSTTNLPKTAVNTVSILTTTTSSTQCTQTPLEPKAHNALTTYVPQTESLSTAILETGVSSIPVQVNAKHEKRRIPVEQANEKSIAKHKTDPSPAIVRSPAVSLDISAADPHGTSDKTMEVNESTRNTEPVVFENGTPVDLPTDKGNLKNISITANGTPTGLLDTGGAKKKTNDEEATDLPAKKYTIEIQPSGDRISTHEGAREVAPSITGRVRLDDKPAVEIEGIEVSTEAHGGNPADHDDFNEKQHLREEKASDHTLPESVTTEYSTPVAAGADSFYEQTSSFEQLKREGPVETDYPIDKGSLETDATRIASLPTPVCSVPSKAQLHTDHQDKAKARPHIVRSATANFFDVLQVGDAASESPTGSDEDSQEMDQAVSNEKKQTAEILTPVSVKNDYKTPSEANDQGWEKAKSKQKGRGREKRSRNKVGEQQQCNGSEQRAIPLNFRNAHSSTNNLSRRPSSAPTTPKTDGSLSSNVQLKRSSAQSHVERRSDVMSDEMDVEYTLNNAEAQLQRTQTYQHEEARLVTRAYDELDHILAQQSLDADAAIAARHASRPPDLISKIHAPTQPVDRRPFERKVLVLTNSGTIENQVSPAKVPRLRINGEDLKRLIAQKTEALLKGTQLQNRSVDSEDLGLATGVPQSSSNRETSDVAHAHVETWKYGKTCSSEELQYKPSIDTAIPPSSPFSEQSRVPDSALERATPQQSSSAQYWSK